MAHPTDARLAVLDTSLRRARYAPDELIELLHVAQDLYGSLSQEVLEHLARELELPPSLVYGVATFYHLFTFAPPGAHRCTVCTGTACFVKGADALLDAVAAAYDVVPGGTSPDGQVSLATGRCLGSCGQAPVVVLDGSVLGYQDPEAVVEAVRGVLAASGQDS